MVSEKLGSIAKFFGLSPSEGYGFRLKPIKVPNCRKYEAMLLLKGGCRFSMTHKNCEGPKLAAFT